MENKLLRITKREKDIMQVLWYSNESLTASSIAEKGNGLSINTVQAALRSLIKKKYIEIDNIVYSGTVLTRNYKPIISAERYAANQLQEIRANTLNFSTLNFINHLLKKDNLNILDELEDIIKSKKKKEDD